MRSRNRPPASTSLPVIGHALPFVRNPIDFLLRQHQTHGDVFRLALGPLEINMIAHPDLGLRILKQGLSGFRKLPEHRRFIRGIMTDGLVTSLPDLWKRQRKELQPRFSYKEVEKRAS
ncbi:MAG: cytochrome P450, partial [Acidobacteriota bacterium]